MSEARLKFRTLILAGGMVLMLVPAAIAGWLYTGALQNEAEAIMAASLKARGEIATDQFSRRLLGLWISVDHLAAALTTDQPAEMRRDFSIVDRVDPRTSWLGFADVSGKVLSSSTGRLEGQDVSQQQWFRRGLSAPFAGDVHEAVVAANLSARDNVPTRYVDLATPVRDPRGVTVGVLGAHVDWTWVGHQLNSVGNRGIDVLLIAGDRRILHGPVGLEGSQLNTSGAIAASQGRSWVGPELWPDGKYYMTVTIPFEQYQDLPSFGWSVIVRQDLDSALANTRALVRSFWLMLGSGTFCSLILLYFAAGWLATPLLRLGEFATRLSTGTANEAPHEETRYQEASQLSSALVRLQSQLKHQP